LKLKLFILITLDYFCWVADWFQL